MSTFSTLLYGPQGCGKSLFAEATFGELQQADQGQSFVQFTASSILEDPVKNIKRAFEAIERFEILGVLIEDVDDLLIDLRSFPSARRYLLDQIKQTEKRRILFATARRPESLQPNELAAFTDILPIIPIAKIDLTSFGYMSVKVLLLTNLSN